MYNTSAPAGATTLPATGASAAALSNGHIALIALSLIVFGFALLVASGAAGRLVPAGVRRGARDRGSRIVRSARRR